MTIETLLVFTGGVALGTVAWFLKDWWAIERAKSAAEAAKPIEVEWFKIPEWVENKPVYNEEQYQQLQEKNHWMMPFKFTEEQKRVAANIDTDAWIEWSNHIIREAREKESQTIDSGGGWEYSSNQNK